MKLFRESLLFSLICGLVLLAIAHTPDIKGAGESENAFSWQEKDGYRVSVPYSLEDDPIVIHGENFTLINPSPHKQFLRVTGPQGQYRVRYRLPMTMPARVGFTIETVSLADSTVTSNFEVQTTS